MRQRICSGCGSLRKSHILPFCFLIGVAFLSTLAAAPQTEQVEKILRRQWPGNARLNIPEVKKAPVIDGIITPDEWKNAAQFSGFTLLNGNYVTGDTGSVRIMRDKTHLYLAVRTTTPNNDPGGSLTAAVTTRDGNVYQDDSLDFMLISDREPQKMYHWIVNSRDTLFDRVCGVAPSKNSNPAWNFRNLKLRSRVDNGFWDLEMACPLKEVGEPQKFLKINIGRNWSKSGSSLLNPGKFFDVKRLITVRWDRHSGILKQMDPGDVGRGEWRVSLAADNLSPAELQLAVRLCHYTHANKKKTEHRDLFKTIRIPSGKSGSLNAAFQAQGKMRYHYTAVLFDPVSGKIHGSRVFSGAQGRTDRHPVSVEFSLKGRGSGACRY